MLHIIFRTCDKVNSLHNFPRPFGLSKADVIKASFTSIIKSFSHTTIALTILGDDLSNDLLNWFKIQEVSISKLINQKFGNNASLNRMLDLAEEPAIQEEDIVYFVEDDYLHFHYIAGNVMQNFFDQFPTYFYFPADYPDQYSREDLCKPAWIFLGKIHTLQASQFNNFHFCCQGENNKKIYSSHEARCF